MSETDNRRMIEDTFAALNAHDPDRYVKSLDDSYVMESDALPTPVHGPEGAKQVVVMYFKAFPDLHFKTELISLQCYSSLASSPLEKPQERRIKTPTE